MTKEERKIYSKNYRIKNIERDKLYKKKYLEKNREKIMAWRKEYKRKNKDKLNAQERLFRKENPQRYKDRYRKHYYGVNNGGFEEMIKVQEDRCAICEAKMNHDFNRLIDHDHITNKVREILCRKCNCGIGFFKDNLELIEKAANYIRKWNLINHASSLKYSEEIVSSNKTLEDVLR